ncbi:MAG: SgcJ/EcaC family oxidoreductase [Acidobacteriota bacterium]
MSFDRFKLLILLVAATLTFTATADEATLGDAHAEVQAASQAWIDAFNRGDYRACAAGYTEEASMQGRPLANLEGRAAIEDFWKGVLAQNPGQLSYEDPKIHVLDENTAVLSARWTMTRLGRGIITLERWQKQSDGAWLLSEDIFEISESFVPQPATASE